METIEGSLDGAVDHGSSVDIKDVHEKETDLHPLGEVNISYLSSLRNISEAVQILVPHLSKWLVDELNKCEDVFKSYLPDDGEMSPESDDKVRKVILTSAHDYAEFTSLMKRLDYLQQNRAMLVLMQSMFMQIFCEFDAFMGAMLKAIYLRNEGLLKGVSREISLADLIGYESLDSVKRAMLEKEIETFRRDSYVEQFSQLEKKFSISLKKFPEWSEFVELSQRRNIFTHNNGAVSEQYLVVCEREGWKFDSRPRIGDVLNVSYEYFSRAIRLMSKIGCMLSHTLWKKIFPSESSDVHESLNDIIYGCLEDKRWRLAADFRDFALSEPMKRDISEVNLKVRVINMAIGLKFSGQGEEAVALIREYDWSASYRDFKLALCVLEDEFDEAIKLMESIGRSGEILVQHSYHIWPLFHKFRERPEFYETYERIYGVPYATEVSSDGSQAKVTLGHVLDDGSK